MGTLRAVLGRHAASVEVRCGQVGRRRGALVDGCYERCEPVCEFCCKALGGRTEKTLCWLCVSPRARC